MTSDADDALSWEGDEERGLPRGWKAVGRGSEKAASADAPDTPGARDVRAEPTEPQPLSTPMLLLVGVVGGIYLLYTVGWIIGGLNLQMRALFLVPSVMYQVGVWAAVLAPALWFSAVWVLTRRSAAWVRVLGLFAGVLLLVPWPFVMTGAVGA